jgi:hypothetical protein
VAVTISSSNAIAAGSEQGPPCAPAADTAAEAFAPFDALLQDEQEASQGIDPDEGEERPGVQLPAGLLPDVQSPVRQRSDLELAGLAGNAPSFELPVDANASVPGDAASGAALRVRAGAGGRQAHGRWRLESDPDAPGPVGDRKRSDDDRAQDAGAFAIASLLPAPAAPPAPSVAPESEREPPAAPDPAVAPPATDAALSADSGMPCTDVAANARRGAQHGDAGGAAPRSGEVPVDAARPGFASMRETGDTAVPFGTTGDVSSYPDATHDRRLALDPTRGRTPINEISRKAGDAPLQNQTALSPTQGEAPDASAARRNLPSRAAEVAALVARACAHEASGPSGPAASAPYTAEAAPMPDRAGGVEAAAEARSIGMRPADVRITDTRIIDARIVDARIIDARVSDVIAPIAAAPHLVMHQGEGAPATAVSAPPEPPSAIADEASLASQIVQRMRLQWLGGSGNATIALDPEYLGTVGIQLTVGRAGVVTATLSADSADVRAWMQAHESTLRDQLASQGLSLDRLQIVGDEARSAHGSPDDARRQRWKPPTPPQANRRKPTETFRVIV